MRSAAYAFLHWEDREMALRLDSWSTAPLPASDTLDALQSVRAEAQKMLASPESHAASCDRQRHEWGGVGFARGLKCGD